MADLSSWDRDQTTCRASNIYSVALYRGSCFSLHSLYGNMEPQSTKRYLEVFIIEIPFLSLQATHVCQKLIFIFLIHIHRTLLILYYAHFLYQNGYHTTSA